jgi:hypothetical protein
MRCLSLRAAPAAVLLLSAVAVASAQTPVTGRPAAPPSANTTSPARAPKVLTGKERLGEKWQDEQRIDNCKVPIDKRGTKPRPDACAKPSS